MNIIAALNRAGVIYKFKPNDPEELLINCPFCTDRGESPDTRFRLALNIRKNKANCKNCDWSAGDKAIEAISNRLALDVQRDLWSFKDEPDVAEELKDEEPQIKKAPPEYGPPEGFFALAGYRPLENAPLDPIADAVNYIDRRGITWEQVTQHGIGVCLRGKYHHRIVFPILRPKTDTPVYERGMNPEKDYLCWRGFAARAFNPNTSKKIMNSSCENHLWVSSFRRRPQRNYLSYVVVAEGIIKALAIERQLPPNSVSCSLQGHNISEEQISELPSDRIVLLFPDPDPVGLMGFLKVARILNRTHEVCFPRDLPSKQADEMRHADLKNCLNQVQSFSPLVELQIRAVVESRRAGEFYA